MKYILVGSLGNITKPLASQLIASGHDVTIISSQAERQAAIAALGARAAIGTVQDAAFLAKAFIGADAVYTMVPPAFPPGSWKDYIHSIGKHFATAIKAAGVKKAVNLSSVGAHMPKGCGPVSGLHFEEKELNDLPGTDVRHLRPAYFYSNFYHDTGMIKNAGIYGNNFGGDTPLTMVHPDDIAAVAARELSGLHFTGKSFLYIAGDEKTSREIARILGAAIGKPGLPYVEFSDEDALKGLLQAGFPEEIARNYVEMGSAVRSGEMIADLKKNPVKMEKIKLEDFAKQFAAAYSKA